MEREAPQWLEVGEGEDRRRLALLSQPGEGAPVVWLGGFRSDMRATKAEALAQWARETGRPFLRFDYAGHGESGGDFARWTLSHWLADALAERVSDDEREVLVEAAEILLRLTI